MKSTYDHIQFSNASNFVINFAGTPSDAPKNVTEITSTTEVTPTTDTSSTVSSIEKDSTTQGTTKIPDVSNNIHIHEGQSIMLLYVLKATIQVKAHAKF